jgi:hypothetical protein
LKIVHIYKAIFNRLTQRLLGRLTVSLVNGKAVPDAREVEEALRKEAN